MVSLPGREHRGGTVERLIARLPAFYREQPGPVLDLLDAVAESVCRFDRVLEERAGAPPLPARRAALAAAPAAPGALSTAGAFREWLERACGAAPRMWPGIELEEIDAGAGGLRVRSSGPRRGLVVAWVGAAAAAADLFARGELARDRRPVGLRVQFALVSSTPADPPAEGTVLEGSLLGTWK